MIRGKCEKTNISPFQPFLFFSLTHVWCIGNHCIIESGEIWLYSSNQQTHASFKNDIEFNLSEIWIWIFPFFGFWKFLWKFACCWTSATTCVWCVTICCVLWAQNHFTMCSTEQSGGVFGSCRERVQQWGIWDWKTCLYPCFSSIKESHVTEETTNCVFHAQHLPICVLSFQISSDFIGYIAVLMYLFNLLCIFSLSFLKCLLF